MLDQFLADQIPDEEQRISYFNSPLSDDFLIYFARNVSAGDQRFNKFCGHTLYSAPKDGDVCAHNVVVALLETYDSLSKYISSFPSLWKWKSVHVAVFLGETLYLYG